MKVSNVEGTPEEIKNIFQNNGMNLADYIERPDPPLLKKWVIIPSVSLMFLVIYIVYMPWGGDREKLLLFVLSVCIGVWLCVAIQLKFKSSTATSVLAIGALLVLLLASGIIKPTEIASTAKQFKSDK